MARRARQDRGRDNPEQPPPALHTHPSNPILIQPPALSNPKTAPGALPWADKLRENQLATVRALPKRFAELDRNKPLVASISITPVSKANAELA
jgi:hypothetical protein